MIFENNMVYVDYNDNLFNFNKLEEYEKLVCVDLENQEILPFDNNDADDNLSEEVIKYSNIHIMIYSYNKYNPRLHNEKNLSPLTTSQYPQAIHI